MSYNISNWKTKKIDNLVIPINSFYSSPRKDWHPTIKISGIHQDEVLIECGCEQTINGKLIIDSSLNKFIDISEINMCGEGSGTFYSYVLENALKCSKGKLIAILIWENGDSIEKLKVNNGEIATKNIDL